MFFVPVAVFAQATPPPTPPPTPPGTEAGTIGGLLIKVGQILDMVLPIIIAIAVITFLWGVVGYMTAGADEEKRGQSRNLMIYGVIGLFVMVSIWGLVAVFGRTFGIGQGGGAIAPKLPGITP